MNLLDHIIKPSTRELYREARRTPGYSFWDFVHGYAYTRWPNQYISLGLGEHPLSRLLSPLISRVTGLIESKTGPDGREATFADTYHGKALPTKQAAKLISVKRPVDTTLPEQVVPYTLARDIVLSGDAPIAVLDCPCRKSRKNPCTPMDVCLIVGEPFTSFVVEHHPKTSRLASVDEAQAILEAERKRGHVHHAFFKDAMLGRFYAVCNCCACCCGAMQVSRDFGVPMLCSSGYVCALESDACEGCGLCVRKCQFGALSLVDGKVRVDPEACLGCGVCVHACPANALSLELAPDKGAPLEVAGLG